MAEHFTINLLLQPDAAEHREKFEKYKSRIKGFHKKEGSFQVGDKVMFCGGLNGEIKYISEILGFDKDGDCYVLWDCYWFPIKIEERLIKRL